MWVGFYSGAFDRTFRKCRSIGIRYLLHISNNRCTPLWSSPPRRLFTYGWTTWHTTLRSTGPREFQRNKDLLIPLGRTTSQVASFSLHAGMNQDLLFAGWTLYLARATDLLINKNEKPLVVVLKWNRRALLPPLWIINLCEFDESSRTKGPSWGNRIVAASNSMSTRSAPNR